MPSVPGDLNVLVVAPVGRDGELIRQALASAGISSSIVSTIREAIARVRREPVGAMLTTEEVMDSGIVAMLAAELGRQPAWSDLPILILTLGGSSTVLSRQRERDRLPLGSVTLLERPIRMATLISSVRSALRSRSRQYEVRDILHERDRAEASLKESEGRLRLAVEAASLGFWDLDYVSGRMEASDIFRAQLDLPSDGTLTAAECLDRIHPEDRAMVDQRLRRAVKAQGSFAGEYRVNRPDGGVRWLTGSGRILVDGTLTATTAANEPVDGRGARMVGVTLDVTDRVLSEAALRKADKLALVGRLASSIAHEINNPLEAVTNLLYLLSVAKLGRTDRGYVQLAQQELARVSEIAAQTLTFNRQQNSYEEAVIPVILDSVLALYQGRLTTSKITVRRDYRCNQPIRCYPGELRQVFTNLVGNAFDAMRQGGSIRVRERLASDPVTGRQGIRITVADTGSGMTPEVRDHVFEAFYSTKGNNGTGLGLWISRGVIGKHGGSLRVSSSMSPGHAGTVFSIFLPLAR